MASRRPLRTLIRLAGGHKALPVSFLHVPLEQSFTDLRHAPNLSSNRSSSSVGPLIATVLCSIGLELARNYVLGQSAHDDSKIHMDRELEAAICVAAGIENPPRENLIQSHVDTAIRAKTSTGHLINSPEKLVELTMPSDPAADPKVIGYVLAVPDDRGINRDAMVQVVTTVLRFQEYSGELVVPGRGAFVSSLRHEITLWAYEGGVLRAVWKFNAGAGRVTMAQE